MIMSRPIEHAFCLITTLFCLCLSEHAEATTASVKAMGMGGCAIAYPQDTLALAWNPATAVTVGNRFDANAGWLQTRGKMTLLGNSCSGLPDAHYESNVHPNVFDAEFGANYIVCGGCDVAVGLIGYNKHYMHTHYSQVIPFLGRTEQALERIQEVISPVLAIRLDCHDFGIAVQFAGQRFKANGLQNLDTFFCSVNPDSFTNQGHDYSYGVGIVAGWLWHMYPGVRMGFVYESETVMTDFDKYTGLLPDKGHLELPERFSLGFSFDFTCHLHAAIDMHLIRWSRTQMGNLSTLGPQTSSNLPLSFILDSNQCFHHKNKMRKFGSSHGPAFGWKDQPIIRLGIDYSIPCLSMVIRGGYYWARTPIRANDAVANILTLETTESVITIGASTTPWYSLGLNHEFSFCYAYGFTDTVQGSRHKRISPFYGGGTANLSNGFQFAKIGYGVTY